ncbi:hypothetical protein ACFWA6_13995 [Streptomyces sp. NPDC060020]|uniref:hypothetical protein n=1 Tax=Streptomyces sp. NPDC060020 TaxID=3347038 RepID=UPI0036920546
MTTSTAALNLATIGILWPHLDNALDQHGASNWPPAGRMRDYLTALDQHDADEAAALRALERDPQQVGETRAPLNIRILDTARLVERLLVDLADEIAPQITLDPLTHARVDHARPGRTLDAWQARGWTTSDREQRNVQADAEQGDPRRWQYTGLRTVEYAAGWLYARVQGDDGPFRALTLHHHDRITLVAGGCVDRIRAALNLLDHRQTLADPCPRCRGTVVMATAGGADPTAECTGCSRVWTLADTVAA